LRAERTGKEHFSYTYINTNTLILKRTTVKYRFITKRNIYQSVISTFLNFLNIQSIKILVIKRYCTQYNGQSLSTISKYELSNEKF
jgi:hypothetical protein